MELALIEGRRLPVPRDATVHKVVLGHAARAPHAPALRRPDGTVVGYGDLVRRALAVRDRLTAAGVAPGDFVPVVAVAGEEFAAAALGVLLTGAAYAAVDPGWPADRVDGLLHDLAAKVVLHATGGMRPLDGTLTVTLPGPDEAPAAGGDARAWQGVPPGDLPGSASDAACVFFTSGSTGRPKGVVVPHRAFVRTFVDGGFADLGPGTVMPLLAAPYWDGGALDLFASLMNGGSCAVVGDPLLTPRGLRALVAQQGVNTMWLTSSLVNLIVDEDVEAFAGLRHLMTGGERLSPPHIAALLAAHPDLRLTNGYGPVESLVFVSTHDVAAGEADIPDGPPIGLPVRGTVLAVMDESGRPVERGTDGELWVAGDGLALGYLDRPQENERRFTRVNLPGHGTLRAYRTGDRVRMDPAGRLWFVGRTDRQFKVRGHRVEPGEVEQGMAGLPGVRQAFLVPLHDDRSTVVGTVCVYATDSGDPLPAARLRAHAEQRLPGYLRPDRYLHLDPVPLGPTGKADVGAVREWARGRLADSAGDAVAAPGSPALREVRLILGAPGLAADDDLLGAGANSLHVLRTAARLSRLLGTALSARDVYRHPNVAALERLAQERPAAAVPPSPEQPPTGALSPGERRFWLAEWLAPGAPGHVVVCRWEVTGPLDMGRLEGALAAVAAAHPALRTVFPRQGTHPLRTPAAPAAPPVLVRHSAGDPLAEERELTAELAAGLHDLAAGPLFGVAVLALGETRHLLLVGVHHIVFDGRSEEIAVADLAAAYAGQPLRQGSLPPERTEVAEDERERQRAFWREQVADSAPLALPAGGLPMREVWTREVAAQPLRLSAGQTAALRASAERNRCPVLVPLLAAWWRTLATITGRHDIVIGTLLDDRAVEHDRTVGYLVNGLPVRIRAELGTSEAQLTALVRERLLEVFAHTALPTDEVALLAPRPDGGRSPLYQNMLVLQRTAAAATAGDVCFTPLPAPPLGLQSELYCELWDDGGDFAGVLQAPQGLLDPADLREIARVFLSELPDEDAR